MGQASHNNSNTGQAQQDYTRMDEDPFNNNEVSIEVDDSDLPF